MAEDIRRRRVAKKSIFREMDLINETDLDLKTRLLRSQLRREAALQQEHLMSRPQRKPIRSTNHSKPAALEAPVTQQSQHFYPPSYFPLYTSYNGLEERTKTNVKSELMDIMMMQNSQFHQMIIQQMALSMIPQHSRNPPPPNLRSNHSDKDVIDLLTNFMKKRSNRQSDPPISLVPYVLPVYHQKLPELVPRKERSHDNLSQPVMTSRWKPRLTEEDTHIKYRKPQPVHHLFRTNDIHHRRRVLKKFRMAAYVALFTRIMINRKPNRLMHVLRKPVFSEELMTGIRLKECVSALHRIYLKPTGKMIAILSKIYDMNIDLTSVLTETGSKEDRKKAFESLGSILENVVYEMTFPLTDLGTLGTNSKSSLCRLIQPETLFPENYFRIGEKDLLKIGANFRTPETIGNHEALIILMGICFDRGFISTILRYPAQFNLISTATESLPRRIKLIFTIFVYLLRRLYSTDRTAVPPPEELTRKLYSDETMAEVYTKLNSNFEYSEKLLRDWGHKYVRQLRNSEN